MQKAENPYSRLRFGVFEMDLGTGELRKHGVQIRLQKQPFQVLAILLEHAGEVVTREELQKNLWPTDTFVDFDHRLNKAINKIRDALGDSAESPRFLETVSRRGYRFLAEVKFVGVGSVSVRVPTAEMAGLSVAHDSHLAKTAPRPVTRKDLTPSLVRRRLGAVLAVLLIILAASALYFRNRSSSSLIRSLAVLPLESLSGDASQDYFADGMTDELITDLGQISALRVISRTSMMTYKHVRKLLPEIARELDVEAVVEGSVLRSGERVRITAQLIRVPVERHIWAQSFEGDLRDTLVLQKSVARALAEQIQASLNQREQAALEHSKVVNSEAYEAYLKGRYFWNKRTRDGLTKAIEYFSSAIEKNPKYAEAYTGLGDAYALSGDWEYGILSPQDAFPSAKAAVTKALALDDKLAEAHTSLAFILDLYDWDWESAETEYKRAIALNPGYATAHHWYAWHLIVMGRNGEGIAELRKAQSLDPFSLIISADLADALCIAHLYDESVQQSRRTLEMDPNFAIAHYELGQAYEQKNMHNEAIEQFKRAIQLAGDNEIFNANLAYAYAFSDRREEALKMLKDLED